MLNASPNHDYALGNCSNYSSNRTIRWAVSISDSLARNEVMLTNARILRGHDRRSGV